MKNAYFFNILQEAVSKLYGILTRDPYPLKRILNERYNKINPNLILDVGCGIGNYAINENSYVGIDLNYNYLKYSKSKNKIGKVALMDAGSLGFMNETFDIVLMSSIGHHINNCNLEASILEAKRVLRKNGYFLFVDVIRPLMPYKWLCMILEKCDEGCFFRNEDDYIDLLKKHFILLEKIIYRDQFYNSIFLRLTK